ncbi:hypothetical protein G7047_13290 [Diaphorobacter sp. HDW4A]|uniref:S1 family peptidase n=1 Tax=Diaphorobacter sp. HDW4A TaxID=2714924 RepID=UPI00140CF1E8|nr:S1 family peptidase [Diaphorobacter sp. HDW4A]QIL80769.1 hypothetical protein G7047_13290 [Diaphorobacter sp. HDW4A]
MKYKLLVSLLGVSFVAGVHAENQVVGHATKELAIKAAGLEKFATPQNEDIFNSISKNLNIVKEAVGDGYGGTWVEYDENYIAHQIVAVSGDGVGMVKSIQTENPISVVEVRYTYKELEVMREKIYDLFQSLALPGQLSVVNSIALDEQNNALRVRGNEENLDFIRIQLEKNGFDTSAIFIEKGGRAKLFGQLFGGTKIGASQDDSTPTMFLCTNGFNALADGYLTVSITAGHCNSKHFPTFTTAFFNNGGTAQGTSIKGVKIGGFIGNEFAAPSGTVGMDATMFANVNGTHSQYPQILTSPPSVANVLPLASIVQNTMNCHSGATSGWNCGVQLSTSVLRNINDLKPTVKFYLAESTACGAQGDSGGPVVDYTNHALGIYVGVDGPADNTCGEVIGGGGSAPNSLYQPLAPYLALYTQTKLLTN